MLLHPATLGREDVTAIRESAAWMLRDFFEWSGRFFDRVFAARPGLRVLFAEDLRPQQRKWLLTMSALLGALDQLDNLEARLQRLGAAHRIYGAKAAHYPIINRALIDTLAESGGAAFTPVHREAWNRLLAFVTSAMLRGAESGAEHLD